MTVRARIPPAHHDAGTIGVATRKTGHGGGTFRSSFVKQCQGLEPELLRARLDAEFVNLTASEQHSAAKIFKHYLKRKPLPPAERPFLLLRIMDLVLSRRVMLDFWPQVSEMGDYRFLEKVGSGAFGSVMLAQHVFTGMKVAIKCVNKTALLQRPKQRAALVRELRVLRLIDHPHIIKVLDIIETYDMIYIVMEHEAGGELFHTISTSSGGLTEAEARRLFRQILSALDFCHRNFIVHRDLKLENLLLDQYGNIKLADFGFVNLYGEGLLDTYCGSPYYAAPEMTCGVRYTGPEIDIWSLGVILFAMCAGRLPFDAPNMNMPTLYDKIRKGEYRMESGFSGELQTLVRGMLAVSPQKRMKLLDVLNHPWTNRGYASPPKNWMPHRPSTVERPNPHFLEHLSEFYHPMTAATLGVTLASPEYSSIKTMYCLIEEAYARFERDAMRFQERKNYMRRQRRRGAEGGAILKAMKIESEMVRLAVGPAPALGLEPGGNKVHVCRVLEGSVGDVINQVSNCSPEPGPEQTLKATSVACGAPSTEMNVTCSSTGTSSTVRKSDTTNTSRVSQPPSSTSKQSYRSANALKPGPTCASSHSTTRASSTEVDPCSFSPAAATQAASACGSAPTVNAGSSPAMLSLRQTKVGIVGSHGLKSYNVVVKRAWCVIGARLRASCTPGPRHHRGTSHLTASASSDRDHSAPVATTSAPSADKEKSLTQSHTLSQTTFHAKRLLVVAAVSKLFHHRKEAGGAEKDVRSSSVTPSIRRIAKKAVSKRGMKRLITGFAGAAA